MLAWTLLGWQEWCERGSDAPSKHRASAAEARIARRAQMLSSSSFVSTITLNGTSSKPAENKSFQCPLRLRCPVLSILSRYRGLLETYQSARTGILSKWQKMEVEERCPSNAEIDRLASTALPVQLVESERQDAMERCQHVADAQPTMKTAISTSTKPFP